MRRAVCLLSGGLDSTTCLAWAKAEGFACYALSFDYGQRHRVELEAARRVADGMGVEEHQTAKIDLRMFGGSALTADIDVPKHGSAGDGISRRMVRAQWLVTQRTCLTYWDFLIGPGSIS